MARATGEWPGSEPRGDWKSRAARSPDAAGVGEIENNVITRYMPAQLCRLRSRPGGPGAAAGEGPARYRNYLLIGTYCGLYKE
ncbi:hypothetical protein GCM10009835_38670 [Planosporangium flavigriseum]|uniref:Uncharacterized protein n=1 Tax=Planosporangium flavigriseum TaxID=373681 RepID=A0A8J3LUG9_9ACTN|nr:hypothetical protein Pfl04_24680 [Planosporangium flavigriseum]